MSTNNFNLNSLTTSYGVVRLAVNKSNDGSIKSADGSAFTKYVPGYSDYSVFVNRVVEDGVVVYYEPDGTPVPAEQAEYVSELKDAQGGAIYLFTKSKLRIFAFSGPHARLIQRLIKEGKTAVSALIIASVNHGLGSYADSEGETRFAVNEVFNVIQVDVCDGYLPTTMFRTSSVVMAYGEGVVDKNSLGVQQARARGVMRPYKGVDATGKPVYGEQSLTLFGDEGLFARFKLFSPGVHVGVDGAIKGQVSHYGDEPSVDRVINVVDIKTSFPTRGAGVATIKGDPVIKTVDGVKVGDAYVLTRSDGRGRNETYDVFAKLTVWNGEAERLEKYGADGMDVVISDCVVTPEAWKNDKGELESRVAFRNAEIRIPGTKTMTRSFITFGMGHLAETPVAGKTQRGASAATLRVISDYRQASSGKIVKQTADIAAFGPIADQYAKSLVKGQGVAYVAALAGANKAFAPQTGESAGEPVATLNLRQMDVRFLNRPRVRGEEEADGAAEGDQDAAAPESAQDAAASVAVPQPEAAADEPVVADGEAPSGDFVVDGYETSGVESPQDFRDKMRSLGRAASDGVGKTLSGVGSAISNIS